MASISLAHKLNKFCLSALLVSFSLASITPTYVYAQTEIFNNVALMVRLENLVEKLMKLKNKPNINKMIDIVLDVKGEIETATNTSIGLEQKLDELQREMRQKGYKPPKKQWEAFRKKFKQKEKNQKHRTEYTAIILADPYATFSFEDEQLLFAAKHSHDKKENEDEKEEAKIEIPATVAFGITVALCGLFLVCLPIPQAKTWGAELLKYGVALAVEEGVRHNANNQDKDKK